MDWQAIGGVAGLVLAAGPGERFGGPKALVRTGDGQPWVRARAQTLLDGGCAPVVVTVGAAGAVVRSLLPDGVAAVVVDRWERGEAASLHAGLVAVARLSEAPGAVLIAVVDTPGLTAAAVNRLIRATLSTGPIPGALVQAHYAGRPGHPVVLGRDRWASVAAAAHDDAALADYLRAAQHEVTAVECGDIADGRDVDSVDLLSAQPGPLGW